MPMFSELAREARLDALDFLRTLITDPASLADDDDENATLDLDTLHHRRLAATAILRFQVDEADDFEYDDGDDDDNDDHDPDSNPEDDAGGEHSDDNEDPYPDDDHGVYDDADENDIADEDGVEHDEREDVIDTNTDDAHEPDDDALDDASNEADDAAADATDEHDTAFSPDDDAAVFDAESKLPAPPGPGGANERSHGWSSRQRAQPVERIVIDSSRPGGAEDAHATDVHAFSLAPPHTPAAPHIP